MKMTMGKGKIDFLNDIDIPVAADALKEADNNICMQKNINWYLQI